MSQRVSKVGNIKYALSGDHPFIASVEPGETFVVECAPMTARSAISDSN